MTALGQKSFGWHHRGRKKNSEAIFVFPFKES